MTQPVDFFRSFFFDEAYYLEQKAASLNASTAQRWTTDMVRDAIALAGLTPFEHYARYGFREYAADGSLGLDPGPGFSTNAYLSEMAQYKRLDETTFAERLETDPITDYATRTYALGLQPKLADTTTGGLHESRVEAYRDFYFVESEYLQNKTDALNAAQPGAGWTVEKTAQAIAQAGMTPWTHFCRYGAFETDKDDERGIDPGQFFDVSRYYHDKAAMLGLTADAVAGSFKDLGLDPISHYAKYGYLEKGLVPVAEDVGTTRNAGKDMAPTGNALIDAVLVDDLDDWADLNGVGMWQENTIFYIFPDARELQTLDYDYAMTPSGGLQKEAFLDGLSVITKITGVQFAETETMNEATLLFFNAVNAPNRSSNTITLGWTEVLEKDTLAVVLNDSTYVPENADPRFGTPGYSTVLHELGHAMGLKHPFKGMDHNRAVLPEALENKAWTVMSYTDGSDCEGDWFSEDDQYYSPVDILAMQYLYGTDGLNGIEGISYETLA